MFVVQDSKSVSGVLDTAVVRVIPRQSQCTRDAVSVPWSGSFDQFHPHVEDADRGLRPHAAAEATVKVGDQDEPWLQGPQDAVCLWLSAQLPFSQQLLAEARENVFPDV